MSDRLPGKPVTGEVLPPARRETHLPIEPPLSGIPLINRMRYRSVRRELEEYLAVLQTKDAVFREIAQTAEIGEAYNRRLARSERMDDLRRVEGLKVDAELDAALEAAMRQHREAQAGTLAHRARMADLEADAIMAERRLEALKNPPPAPAKPNPSEAFTSEIAKLRKFEREMIAALVGEYANEDDLPDEDRELIRDVRLATRDRITRLVEEMS